MIWAVFLWAVDLNPKGIQELIKPGLDFSYVENFDSAGCYFRRAIELYPDNPAGYFFLGALMQLEMMDGCRYNREAEYVAVMKQGLQRAEAVLDQEENTWAEFYRANYYVYRAVYEGTKRNYLETFNFGLKGGRMMQSLLKKDSTFYDAYLAAGTFEYFWARASRYLPILKLAGGDHEEAIRKIKVAVQQSCYSGPTAENSLAFIYTEEDNYGEAARYADTLLARYPASKTFLWNKANLEYEKKNYGPAAELYRELFTRYEPLANYSNLAQCKLLMGACYYELQDEERARQALKDVIAYKNRMKEYPLIKGYVREAYALLSKTM